MDTKISLALIGAKTLVGEAVLEMLAERGLPLAKVYALDEEKYEGETVSFGNLELDVAFTDDFDFENVQMVLLAAGADTARRFVPDALAAGCAVVDFSSAYRADPAVPFYAPGVAETMPSDGERLISVPNCTVTPLAMALAPFGLGLGRVTVATYQSVSGAGSEAMRELAEQTTALFSQRDAEVGVFAKRIAFNVLPQIGDTDEAGVSAEEASIVSELRRLLGLPELVVEPTCVRVPVFFGHGWAVALELDQPVTAATVVETLTRAGLRVVGKDDAYGPYITPMEATGTDAVWVSRVRVDGRRVQFWLAADNVKAGAAQAIVRGAEAMLAAGCCG
ncbi:aspartate-semialdehyde dehydrogenase [Crenobacter intestini]|uniref:Aspartate-semialdehyde dehydrogenase n=1 Tax=Crenobacter intestini TaxID=2563443 RepID=A0A4T0V2B0_9NEIS|nr:aspartate-semialdehyde dehydrogenase [Crenobacter intestini]TIC85295.1 aspartate-semialdehyde dehydrogenase [Crenobacter intestini]